MTSSCWPTPAQILLLQAALFEGDSARRAFEAWRPNLSSTLDPGSKRLLSLLDRNLRAHRLAPDVPRPVAEAHQRAERENAALVNAVSTVLEAFSDRSIPAIVLKGMPLALAYYPTLACRPMDDCDLMVRQPKVLEARDVLLGLGWRLDGTLDEETIRAAHAVRFTGPENQYIDLHWYAQPETCDERATEDHWRTAEPVKVGGSQALMLCPADMLMHVCVHGLRWSVVPSIRWVADATVVLGTAGGRIDWTRLVENAARQGVVLPMRESLRFLVDVMRSPVPGEVFQRLSTKRVSLVDRLEYRVKQAPRTKARLAVIHWIRHRRMASGTLVGDLVRFPRYLQRLRALRPR